VAVEADSAAVLVALVADSVALAAVTAGVAALLAVGRKQPVESCVL